MKTPLLLKLGKITKNSTFFFPSLPKFLSLSPAEFLDFSERCRGITVIIATLISHTIPEIYVSIFFQPSVRKQHNAGYKHKANVRIYYQQFEEQQTQSLIDQRIKEHLGQAAAFQQVGAVFNQHMLARPRLPMMGPPGSMPMGMRPPVLPRPMMPGQGYMPPPGVPQMMAPPGAPLPPPPQNGMLRPPGMAPIPGQGGNTAPPNYNGLPPPPPYHTNPGAPPGGNFNNPSVGAESPESNE